VEKHVKEYEAKVGEMEGKKCVDKKEVARHWEKIGSLGRSRVTEVMVSGNHYAGRQADGLDVDVNIGERSESNHKFGFIFTYGPLCVCCDGPSTK
jgi:hypothetical protein